MIDARYIRFLAMAALACGMFAVLMWFGGSAPRLRPSVLSIVFGIVFTSLVTVRLPVFRRYYDAVSYSDGSKYSGFANGQAARVLASLLAATAVALTMYVLGVQDLVAPAFLAGIAAGVVSEYHKKKR